jgi:hypothetical protein
VGTVSFTEDLYNTWTYGKVVPRQRLEFVNLSRAGMEQVLDKLAETLRSP